MNLKKIPKIELHDHLDGGLRLRTLIELANAARIPLPTNDPQDLGESIQVGAKDLKQYLKAFTLTLPVMQDGESLERIAMEAVEDWAETGIVYGELRFAPQLHTQKGLTMEEAARSVLRGMEEGTRRTGVEARLLVCALRDREGSLKTVESVQKLRDRGVVGFDLAGPELNWPPNLHREAFEYAKRRDFPITCHAGEEAGPNYIREALEAGARRLGHGTKLIGDSGLLGEVRSRGIHLEVCLSSNLHTGNTLSYGEHPARIYKEKGLSISLSTDNRLVSRTTLTREYEEAQKAWGWGEPLFLQLAQDALSAAFISETERKPIRQKLQVPK